MQVFADDHIMVRQVGFDPASGQLELEIEEKHPGVGFYYITATFESGNSTRIDYDGGNPGRVRNQIVRTGKPNDAVKEIKAVRV